MERLEYFRSGGSLPARRGRAQAHAARAARLAALWTTWRFAAVEVEIAFRQWCEASDAVSATAYAVYVDSLRRESAAAEHLAERYGSAPSHPA
ncbi:MAG: hypothetical protein QOF68_1875 [Gaiellales bacterium]|nr:hypothetical protein [Gaiellales bacterium]